MNNRKFNLGNVLTVSLAHLFHDVYSSFLAPILPLLIHKLGISVFQAGLLDIIRQIPSLMNPLLGLIADKVSVRYLIIIAPAITAVSMSLLGIAPTYTIIAVLIFMAGIGAMLFHVPAPVMIKQVSGDRIGKGMSFYMLGGELARTLGPLIILAAISLWGLDGTWRLAPFGVIASTILFFRLRKIKVIKTDKTRNAVGIRTTLQGMTPFFITIAGIIFFRAGLKAALTIYLPTYLTMKGSSLWIAGASLSILQLAGAAGTFLAGSISDKIGRKNALLIIAIINPLFMWLFTHLHGWLTIPMLIINGFFLFGSGPVLLAMVHDHNSRHMSLINGIYMTISFVLSSIMIMSVGFLTDKIGLDNTYSIITFFALGTIPFVLILKNNKGVEK
ncbi:MAG: MFS transporter [Candidatus Cloacimonetes bacterium]|nr:MFS transporter [Candidatus Cloacimonadota bacterium]